jgi:hypothetical protein
MTEYNIRLYFLQNERQCTVPSYKLPNSELVITKGQIVVIPTYAIHHDEEHFPNPELFDPERFSPEVKASRHPYAYMPFGHGPRNCIGNFLRHMRVYCLKVYWCVIYNFTARRFALVNGKTVLATLVHNFNIEPCERTQIPPKVAVRTGFKPENGLWFKMTPRPRQQ